MIPGMPILLNNGTYFEPEEAGEERARRMYVQRAMIGLVDKDISYFVAEATKTLDLQDITVSEETGSGL